MKSRIAITTLAISTALLLWVAGAAADQREIEFPEVNIVDPHPAGFAFVHGGQIGIIGGFSSKDSSSHLFSFSVATGRITDEFSLRADFGASDPDSPAESIGFLKVHSETGLIVVYGLDSNGFQKVLALASSETGRLCKLWAISYPQRVNGIWPEVAFNEDGTRLFVIYTESASSSASQRFDLLNKRDSTVLLVRTPLRLRPLLITRSPSDAASEIVRQNIAMIGTEDGVTLAIVNLSDGSPFGGTILFDRVHKRAIAFTGQSVYVLMPGSNSFKVESRIVAPDPPSFNIGLGISLNGRYAIAYRGYNVPSGSNIFYSYDLNLGTVRQLSIEENFITGLMTFHRRTGALFVPLTGEVLINDDTISISSSSRLVNIITLAADGSLLHTANVELPERSPGARGPNAITGFNNIEISASGALGFVSSHNGRLFAFDTLTGEIVN
ncbi:MAG TPA: hypothetical protein IGS53_01845, partial [Leptolyngbyaceae cyanobacterium M33_DOE_097]|nr:hypothetical protein [Leptolyngbyaceae cyanobacterium M33_DOE_097]